MVENILYRKLDRPEIERIRTIDRREEIKEVYRHKNGRLIPETVKISVAAFDQPEIDGIVRRQYTLFENGGLITGAFYRESLVGVSSVESHLRGPEKEYSKMDILYVSHDYQKQGVGRRLVELTKEDARSFGARKLYISATPSRNTVDFYLACGAFPATAIDRELFTLEPEDIHLEIIL